MTLLMGSRSSPLFTQICFGAIQSNFAA